MIQKMKKMYKKNKILINYQGYEDQQHISPGEDLDQMPRQQNYK